jgi:CRISPR/Cas system-associated exonuclease Cas4 (RecB family)
MNIESIYHAYLVDMESARRKTENKFHASAAGSCYRKQLYSYFDFPTDTKDNKSYRLLRLGTVVHQDIEDAIEHYCGTSATIEDPEIYVEDNVEIKALNVVGTYDIGEIEDDKFNLYDIKTASPYKWRTIENRKPGTADNYKMQLGTYAIGIKEKYSQVSKVNMFLLWYRKDDSMWRETPVSPEWIDKALDYWVELNSILEDHGESFESDLVPGIWKGVPFNEKWECKYCQYYSICPSNFAEGRTGWVNG